jgi:hypothetical protein
LGPLFAVPLEEAKANKEEIKRLDDEICLVDILICKELEKFHTGERGTVWDDLQQLVIHANQTNATLADILPRLEDLAAKGKKTAQAQRAVIGLIHDKAKLVGIESKRAAAMGEVATREQVRAVLVQIFTAVKTHVKDQKILAAISHDCSPTLRHASFGQQDPKPNGQ